MIVKLLSEHHIEFLSLTGGCRGLSESTFVIMSNCWKSHAATQMLFNIHTCSHNYYLVFCIPYFSHPYKEMSRVNLLKITMCVSSLFMSVR